MRKMRQKKKPVGTITYDFGGRGHVLDLFVKHFLNTLSHRCNGMLGSVESQSVRKDETNITNELVGSVIAGIVWIGVWLGGIGMVEFEFDGREVHGVLNDGRIMRNVEDHRVDRRQKRTCVLMLPEILDSRQTETPLMRSEG